jgi:hypothetical protein
VKPSSRRCRRPAGSARSANAAGPAPGSDWNSTTRSCWTGRSIRPAWHGDGRAYLLKFIDLPAGRHQLTVALSDRPDEDGFDKQQVFILNLAAGDAPVLAIGDGDISLRQAPAPTKEISP